ncbi:MAG: LCP family protein [Actinomycetota bacterium]
MSLPKPTASPPGRAKRLATWLSGWPRMVALALAGVLGLGVALGGIQGIRLLQALDQRDTGGCRTCEKEEASYFADHPRNVLVLGSDTRKGLSEEEQVTFGGPDDVEGRRSDTIILMHIDPGQERAVAIHFPRDLLVAIPGHGEDKINAAFELGGPELAVRTVHRFTGLPIHNYVVVDLAAFQQLVDTVGGVRICVDRPLFDELAGLDIPAAGCHTLDGREALAFVRARHIEGDLIPDFSRIARQQQFMRAMLNRLISARGLLDTDLISEAAGNVVTDDQISGADFIYLGTKLRELAGEDPTGARTLDLRVVPSVPQTIDGVAYVIAEKPAADRLFRRLRAGRPLGELGQVLLQTAISPAQIAVRVLATGDEGAAAAAEGMLRRAGFKVLAGGQAPPSFRRTAILYGPESEDHAQVLSGYVPEVPLRRVSATLLGKADVAVVAGSDLGPVLP